MTDSQEGPTRLLKVLAALLPVAVVATAGCGGDTDRPVEIDSALLAAEGDSVVAEVNGTPVFASQVATIRKAERLRLGSEGRSPVEVGLDDERIRAEALRLAINAELCFQSARAAGMEIAASEVDGRIAGIRSQFAEEAGFEAYLSESGLDLEVLRARTARKMLIGRYLQSMADDLVLDEQAAARVYAEQQERFRDDEEVRAAQIIVRVLPSAGEEQRSAARAKIDEAWSRLQAGEEFAEVAARYSESPFAARGGDLGFIPRGRALPEFEAVVFETPLDAVTPVFETPHGYNIVTVLERREGDVSEFSEVKGALMMLMARDQQAARLRDHLEALRADATILVLEDATDSTAR